MAGEVVVFLAFVGYGLDALIDELPHGLVQVGQVAVEPGDLVEVYVVAEEPAK